MTIKQMFPRMMLFLGLVSILLVSIPGRVAYATYASVEGPVTTTRWTDEQGRTVTKTVNSETGETKVQTFDPADKITTTETYDGKGRKTSRTTSWSQGGEFTTTFDPETGKVKSDSTKYTDGSTETDNYAPNPPCEDSIFRMPYCALSSVTYTEPDGSTRTQTYKPPCQNGPCKPTTVTTYDPRTEYTEVCDNAGNCTDWRKMIDAASMSTLGYPPATTKPTDKPPLVPGGGKDQLQAEVLQQIEDKPRGDLSVGKEKSQTEIAEQLKKKRDGAVSLNPQTLPPGPPPPPEMSGKLQIKDKPLTVGDKGNLGVIPRSKSTGKIFQGGAAAEIKLPAGVLEQMKKKPGEEVMLNPQPLPPGPPPPPEMTGKVQFKDKFKVQPQQVGQKENLNLTPRSQSTGKIFQGGGLSKQKVQTQTVQQNKFKSNYRRWGTSAGSSEAFRAPR